MSKYRKLIATTLWVSEFTCSKCGRKQLFYHHGMRTKKSAMKNVPSHSWNGWLMGRKPVCPACQHPEIKIKVRKSRRFRQLLAMPS